ncbi:MAG: MerR family transcriptional regulator [Oscillospiraceae bacterium]|nr:MerR family transcriptional regulator [Oscillospiraceae bacterium]
MNKNNYSNRTISISEFAEIVDVSASSLRNYDKSGIFPALKDGEGKSRHYDPMQVTLFNMVRVLSEIDMPHKEMLNIVKNRTPQLMFKLLTKQRFIILDKIDLYNEALLVVSTYLDMLTLGMSATETEIMVSEMPEMRMIMGDVNDFTDSDSFHEEFIRFCKAPHSPPVNLAYPIGGYFESMDDYIYTPSQPTRFYSVDRNGEHTKESGLYLIGYTRGYYGEMSDLVTRMVDYANEHGYEFCGSVYNLYLHDEVTVSDPSQYLMQASVMVRKVQQTYSQRSMNRNRFSSR